MKASKFSDAQKAFILKQGADGVPVADLCRKAGISQATYFNWKKKYDGLLPTEMRKLKQLEEENSKLKKLVADLSLDKEMLQVALRLKARPSDLLIFEATTRLLLLRPGDSLISPREILSIGFVGSGWDRDRAHPAVGEGFPILLFRLQAGSQSHHCVCFSKPPYNAGRPDFPGPV